MGVRVNAERERNMVLKSLVESLIGIAKHWVPRVHYVEDFHVIPQTIAR